MCKIAWMHIASPRELLFKPGRQVTESTWSKHRKFAKQWSEMSDSTQRPASKRVLSRNDGVKKLAEQKVAANLNKRDKMILRVG